METGDIMTASELTEQVQARGNRVLRLVLLMVMVVLVLGLTSLGFAITELTQVGQIADRNQEVLERIERLSESDAALLRSLLETDQRFQGSAEEHRQRSEVALQRLETVILCHERTRTRRAFERCIGSSFRFETAARPRSQPSPQPSTDSVPGPPIPPSPSPESSPTCIDGVCLP